MSEGRFDKNFFVDSGLKNSGGKRSIQPNNTNDNAFFQLGHTNQPQASQQNSRGGPPPPRAGGSCPWGTSDDLPANQQQQPNQRAQRQPAGQFIAGGDQERGPTMSEKAAEELRRQQDYYDEHPEDRPSTDFHRQVAHQEKGKGVPWGTLDDIPTQQQQNQIRKDSAVQSQSPFATTQTDNSSAMSHAGRRGGAHNGNSQNGNTISQITF